MKIRKIAMVLGLVVALSGCGSNESKPGDTQTDDKAPTDIEINTERATEMVGDTETEAVTETESEVDYDEINIEGDIKEFSSVVLLNDAAYEYYSYKDETAQQYADVVNEFADNNPNINVYEIVVPLGSGIVFPDNKKDESPTTDQKEAMDSIFAKLNDSVKKVNIYDSLMSHRTEYIYFRTDHHWTQRGAYYAYEDFCEAKGIEAEPLDGFETKDFQGFLGSFYKDTDEAAALMQNEDTVTVYYPKASSTSMHVTPAKGDEYDWEVIFDVSNYKAGIKYSTFVAGDNPISLIKNNELTDGSTCIVVKESYGNAFTPFLVDHYQNIYLVDYRYYEKHLSDLISETGATDVIIINNLTMIKNKFQVGQLKGVLQ